MSFYRIVLIVVDVNEIVDPKACLGNPEFSKWNYGQFGLSSDNMDVRQVLLIAPVRTRLLQIGHFYSKIVMVFSIFFF